ncbi:hypothetical protein BASA83_007945 [Batrachochytrium salamandrivorans]|nr:hypothetical protein BASA83_007945 [Batrachochytrium salamandrivorans]
MNPAVAAASINSKRPVVSLRPGMRDITVECCVIDKLDAPLQTKTGILRHFWVADTTGSILATTPITESSFVNEGDVLILSKAVSVHFGQVQLFVTKIERKGEYSMVFTERPNLSHMEWKENEQGQPVPVSELRYGHWADRSAEPTIFRADTRNGFSNRSNDQGSLNSSSYDSKFRNGRPPFNPTRPPQSSNQRPPLQSSSDQGVVKKPWQDRPPRHTAISSFQTPPSNQPHHRPPPPSMPYDQSGQHAVPQSSQSIANSDSVSFKRKRPE